MKKLLFAFGVFAMAFVASADLDTLITFSTKGPDTYKDGTTVVDGECYALVWTKTGHEFAGINADGSCVDPENNALVLAAPIAQDGKCPNVMYVVRAEQAAQYADGEYGIYLLDTRKTTATVDAEGTATYTSTVGGVDSTGKPTAVNGYGVVASDVAASEGTVGSAAGAVGASAGTVAAIPADAPAPKITSIKIIGDNVYLKVSNTVPYLQYNVAVGATPASQSGAAVTAQNGDASKEITLIVPKDDNKTFFKVQRN